MSLGRAARNSGFCFIPRRPLYPGKRTRGLQLVMLLWAINGHSRNFSLGSFRQNNTQTGRFRFSENPWKISLYTRLCFGHCIVLAGLLRKSYRSGMALGAKRGRWVIALLFAISSVVHAHAVTVSMMNMPTATMDASANDDMDCCDSGKATNVACAAVCATAVAILADPVTTLQPLATEDVEPAVQLPLVSSDPSPEPPPPKSFS